MTKEVIRTPKAPDRPFYSQAIRYGNLVFVSGQTSEDSETGEPIRDSVSGQTVRILTHIRSILEAAGSGLDSVLRVDVYLSSMAIKPEFNEAYLKFFPENRPARNCVAVVGIDDDLDVEIEVIAAVDRPQKDPDDS